MKLRNGVLAELVEAIRHSAMNADFNKSDTLIKTIEKDISTVIKYSDNVFHFLLFNNSIDLHVL